jgi:hypothetical protein
MTTAAAINKLSKNGYKVVFNMSGSVVATKGQKTYREQSINKLIKKIFG